MEELKYQQWSLSRQLASLYASLGMTDETLPKRRAIESWAERENAEEEAERLRSQVRGLLNRLPIKLPTPQVCYRIFSFFIFVVCGRVFHATTDFWVSSMTTFLDDSRFCAQPIYV